MRGKPLHRRYRHRRTRITPAHAGKTQKLKFLVRSPKDHPRACGENPAYNLSGDGELGSPPRMRGKPLFMALLAFSGRITPAHAGKTEEFKPAVITMSDHPRACGENIANRLLSAGLPGSPPRMRGKLSVASACVAPARITPAHAGKTPQKVSRRSAAPDHPRACGENIAFYHFLNGKGGSPPRMRGKPRQRRPRRRPPRITPAHAGKTRYQIQKVLRETDHPRACGENNWQVTRSRNLNGSPPRMRGKL